jgi:hypothetical protein
LYSNRSAAYFYLDDLEAALADAEKSIAVNALWAKVYGAA